MITEELLYEIEVEPLNWDPSFFPEWLKVFSRLLASLPGGEDVEGLGYRPVGGLGWRELGLLTRWLSAIESPSDIRAVAQVLCGVVPRQGRE